MIKFFRHIRKDLMEKNKTGKYFKYAIGEILLVVIGILIALAINDFYQNRINRNEEISLLKSIKEDFSETKKRAKTTISLQARVVEYCSKLETLMYEKNNNVNIDSIGNYLFRGALSYWRIEPVNGTYDAIISSGKIGILQNKKLKRLLAELSTEIKYGFEDESYSLELTALLTEKSSEYAYFLLPIDLQKTKYSNRLVNYDEKKKALSQHLKNNSFLGILNSKKVMENNRLEYQKNILKSVENIITLIESELEN